MLQPPESIAETLRVNATLTSLNLSKNSIGDHGAKSLSEALKVNVSLNNLNLSVNSIGAAGAESVADALKRNATLTLLDYQSTLLVIVEPNHLLRLLRPMPP